MLEVTDSTTSSPPNGAEQIIAGNDTRVSTDNLSPEAARRFERFAGLVASFEKAAASGALSPPATSGARGGR